MKKISCFIIGVFIFIMFSGCIIMDYYKYFTIDLQHLTTCYKNCETEFQKTASIFEKYPELHMVTKNRSWLNSPRKDYVVKECNSLIILTRKEVFSEAQYNEIAEAVLPLFEQRDLDSVVWLNGKLEFAYITVFQGSNGWLYTPDGTEPDKELNYISEMEKINDNWYSVIWAS